MTEMLVMEFPTQSIDGLNLFGNDLGLNLRDGDIFPLDIIEGTITSMNCHIQLGYQTI